MKTYLLIILLFTILTATFVTAIVFYDTDGGDNIYKKGTCADHLGKHTDTCVEIDVVLEHYPSSNETADSFCLGTYIAC